MLGLKVNLKHAENALRLLSGSKLKDKKFNIVKKSGFMYIPIIRASKEISRKLHGEIVNIKFPPADIKPCLRELLKGKIPAEALASLGSSYDIIGTIIVIEVPVSLKGFESEIAKALLKTHNNIETVAKKVGAHTGELRIQDVRVIAGKKSLSTVCRENNAMLRLNISKTYFSPRLATERIRVAALVKPGEDVLVMFSGIAPYPIVIAKNSRARSILGIELNKAAHKFAVENLKINKVENVKLIQGDVRKTVPGLALKFDRVVMPLPKTGEDFLHLALGAVKPHGIIHFYDFEKEEDIPAGSIEKIRKACKKAKRKYKILCATRCGQNAPRQYRVCTDFIVF